MRVAYWPGCVSRGFTPELHGSMAKVAPLLDIELIELDRACCTGAGVIAEHNPELADTLNARTFALAQQVEGADLMMNICSTCQGAQSECQERLDASAEYRARINETLAGEGLSYEQGVTNKRVIYKKGIISRKSEEMKLNSIETVDIDQGIAGRIFGFGDVTVTGRGLSNVVFKSVDDPMAVKRKIESVSNPIG